jgi:hypothetical protein
MERDERLKANLDVVMKPGRFIPLHLKAFLWTKNMLLLTILFLKIDIIILLQIIFLPHDVECFRSLDSIVLFLRS